MIRGLVAGSGATWRSAGRALTACSFLLAVGAAAAVTVVRDTGTTAVRETTFNHDYPPTPVLTKRPKVSGPPPFVPAANRVDGRVSVKDLAHLAALLPSRVLVRAHNSRTWILQRPISIRGHAVASIHDTAIQLRPNAFIEAADGGTLIMRRVVVTAVDLEGHAIDKPEASRGFIVARDGATLRLDRDRLIDLGHLGVVSYGVSLRKPHPSSFIRRSTVLGAYFGVYLSHASGVGIVDNSFVDSWVYGIDPHTESSDLLIAGNTLVRSGTHAIVLADRVKSNVVRNNVIRGAGDHGIVVFKDSGGNRITGNRITGVFDGIVITDSPENSLAANQVEAHRFALRVSGSSARSNTASQNTFSNALVGAYLYGGANQNTLVDNHFVGNLENVRVRDDAPSNHVTPVPPRSELP